MAEFAFGQVVVSEKPTVTVDTLLEPGDYRFQLVVVDDQQALRPGVFGIHRGAGWIGGLARRCAHGRDVFTRPPRAVCCADFTTRCGAGARMGLADTHKKNTAPIRPPPDLPRLYKSGGLGTYGLYRDRIGWCKPSKNPRLLP